MKKKMTNALFILLGYLFPFVSYAAEFVPLSEDIDTVLGGYTPGSGMTEFINKAFGVSVGVAAVLAVIMVAIGGFKYMTSESVFNIGGAKEQITNAIVGLIIVLAAVVILQTINPEIVSLKLFELP